MQLSSRSAAACSRQLARQRPAEWSRRQAVPLGASLPRSRGPPSTGGQPAAASATADCDGVLVAVGQRHVDRAGSCSRRARGRYRRGARWARRRRPGRSRSSATRGGVAGRAQRLEDRLLGRHPGREVQLRAGSGGAVVDLVVGEPAPQEPVAGGPVERRDAGRPTRCRCPCRSCPAPGCCRRCHDSSVRPSPRRPRLRH